MPDPISLATILLILKIAGGITTFSGSIIGVFKVITWIKNKLTNIDSNVVALKDSIDTHINGLREDVKSQTSTIATALSEQRADFRTFYAPSLLMMQNLQNAQSAQLPAVSPVRAKRTVKPAKRKSK